MAIIYTYPDLGAVDGSEKLLVTDGTDENNTKTVTTAAYGAYINATYGGGGGSSIYQADGSITANRQLSGSSLYSLTFTNLTQFTVNTIAAGDIRINPGTGGGVIIDGSDLTFTDGNGIKNSTNPTTSKLYWNNDLFVDSARAINFTCNNANGFTQFTHGTNGLMSIVNGLVVLSGVNNDISDITSGANKTLTTKEWVSDYVANFIGSTNITTLGTITTGTWNGTAVGLAYGGTGVTSVYTQGDMLYYNTAVSTTELTRLPIGTNGQIIRSNGTIPSWSDLTVDNSNWDSLGTALSAANGGTGQTTYAQGDILYGNASGGLSKLSPGTADYVLTTKGAGFDPVWQSPGAFSGTKSIASTQWNTPEGGGTLASLTAGQVVNIFSLIDNTTDKSSAGSTSYYEFNILDDRKATFDTNLGNPIQVVYNGTTNYNGAWNTSYRQTVKDFVDAQNAGGAGTLLGDHGIRCGVDEDGAGVVVNAELRMSVDNGATGDLSLLAITSVGPFAYPSTPLSAAAPARIQIQYIGTPVENQFITHNFRINFETDEAGGSDPEPHTLNFKRWGNGTTIGAPYTFFQTANVNDPNSNLISLISYTSSPTDAFVTQGFFFEIAAENDPLDLENKIGLLIQTYFQQPTGF